MTTEDELMMTSLNLFNKGDALNVLLEKNVCKPNNIKLDDLLLIDKEFLLLFLKETAYGTVIDSNEDKQRFYFDSTNMQIKNMVHTPDENGLFTFNAQGKEFKIKLLTVKDEKVFKKLSKVNKYIYQIHSIGGNTDKGYIKKYITTQPLVPGRELLKLIDKFIFGVNKYTFCLINGKKRDIKVEIDESLFGFTLENLANKNKNINKSIFFLLNEGDGFTWDAVISMPVHIRRFQEEQLIAKLNKLKESMAKK